MGLPPPSCPPCIRNTLSKPASRAFRQCFQRSSAKNLGCSLLIAWYVDPSCTWRSAAPFSSHAIPVWFRAVRAHVPSTADTTNTLRPMFSQILTLSRASGMTGKRIHIPAITNPTQTLCYSPPLGHSAAPGDSMARASSWAVPNTSSAVWRHAAAKF